MSTLMRQKSSEPAAVADRYYTIRSDVKYRVMDGQRVLSTGTGRTKTISRTRVLLDSDNRLPAGLLVELSVAWPVRLDNRVPLKLIIIGRTIASDQQIVIEILRHEFRTQAVRSTDPQPAPTRSSVGRAMAASA